MSDRLILMQILQIMSKMLFRTNNLLPQWIRLKWACKIKWVEAAVELAVLWVAVAVADRLPEEGEKT
jgi:hypothetical protein